MNEHLIYDPTIISKIVGDINKAQKGFVLSFSVYQNPINTRTMMPFLNSIQETYGHLPEFIVADAGYGSESNYMTIIDNFNRTSLMTYGMFIKDKAKKYKSDIFNT